MASDETKQMSGKDGKVIDKNGTGGARPKQRSNKTSNMTNSHQLKVDNSIGGIPSTSDNYCKNLTNGYNANVTNVGFESFLNNHIHGDISIQSDENFFNKDFRFSLAKKTECLVLNDQDGNVRVQPFSVPNGTIAPREAQANGGLFCENENIATGCANGRHPPDSDDGYPTEDRGSREDACECESDRDFDEDYIYTYKGDPTDYLSADLPHSFFRLESGDCESLPGVVGAGPSNLSAGTAALIASGERPSHVPEQDFLEMDFDPGRSDGEGGESDGDSGQGLDEPQGGESMAPSVEEVSLRLEEGEEFRVCLEEGKVLELNNNLIDLEELEEKSLDVTITETRTEEDPSYAKKSGVSSAPILSPAVEEVSLIPRSKSLTTQMFSCKHHDANLCSVVNGDSDGSSTQESSQTGEIEVCVARLLRREALMFCTTDEGAGSGGPFEEVGNGGCEKTMIWTELEACRKQVSQIGASACGATAVVNSSIALGLPFTVQDVCAAVATRRRADDSPLSEYLASRSVAGCNHVDLVAAVESLAGGDVFARFFCTYPERDFRLDTWLGHWISLGAVPIATLNLQRGVPVGQKVPDAWHHQMVFGVGPRGIYLTNPLETVSAGRLARQLTSPSELLVRRSDVLRTWCGTEDLRSLADLGSEWDEYNVLGQVVNVIREASRSGRQFSGSGGTSTRHVKIPASYQAGITLLIKKSSDSYRLLLEAPELPLLATNLGATNI